MPDRLFQQHQRALVVAISIEVACLLVRLLDLWIELFLARAPASLGGIASSSGGTSASGRALELVLVVTRVPEVLQLQIVIGIALTLGPVYIQTHCQLLWWMRVVDARGLLGAYTLQRSIYIGSPQT